MGRIRSSNTVLLVIWRYLYLRRNESVLANRLSKVAVKGDGKDRQ